MILIGLTGGIAAGKSTVSVILQRSFGVHVIDCDAIVRDLQTPNSTAVKQIRALWPACVSSDGVLLREVLGAVVFSDPDARRKLAGIMNPKIFVAVMRRIASEWLRCAVASFSSTSGLVSSSVVVLDAPTLFESKTFLSFVSSVVVVSCADTQQKERLLRRNPQLSPEDADKRIAAQLPLAEKRRRAGYVINNTIDMSLEEETCFLTTAQQQHRGSVLERNVGDAVRWMATQPHVRYPLLICCGGVALVAIAVLATFGHLRG